MKELAVFNLERGRFSEGQRVKEIKKSVGKYFRHWHIESLLVYFVLFQKSEIRQIDKTHKEKFYLNVKNKF